MKLTDTDKESIADSGGYYRTVMGRKVFIKEGQNLGDAMKASGKFGKDGKPNNEDTKAAGKVAGVLKQTANKKTAVRSAALAKVKDRIQKQKNERSFRNQLNQVQNGTFDKNSHLQLGETPAILTKKAGLPKLPLAMPYSKAYLSINKSGGIAGNYHDLGVGTLSSLPTALHSPKYIFEHENPKKIEVVVELKDKKDKNILASIEFGTSGLFEGIRKEANVVVTAFAPRNNNYIETRKKNDKLIYEKKS